MLYIAYLFFLLVFLDWLRLLFKLDDHQALLPANWWLSRIPGVGNLYLRLYFLLEQPTPGSGDPEVKAMLEEDRKYGACRVNIENSSCVSGV